MFGIRKPTTRKGMNSLKNNEEAVSPVIGVILMVAVTVILAAIVAAFFFGMVNSMPQAPQVSYFSVERTADDEITISNTAPIAVEMTNIEVWIDGAEITDTEAGITAPATLSGNLIAHTDIVIGSQPADPVKVLVKARVNGASLQVIQETTV